jgi:hypothetical protein
MSFGALPPIAVSAIISDEAFAVSSVRNAATKGREPALVVRNVRRLSMLSIMADHRLSDEQEGRDSVCVSH